MRKNIRYILAGTLIAMSFLTYRSALAACCIIDPGNCSSPNASGVCTVGTLDSRNCNDIVQCLVSDDLIPSHDSSSTTTTFVNPLGPTDVASLLNGILNNLMGVIAVIAVIFIVIGGIMYMMSGGNEAMVTRAKKTWTGAVIGLAIALAAPTFLKEIQVILHSSGTGGNAQNWVDNALTIKQIAINVLNLLLSLVGIGGIIAMVIGGGMYLTAYGDERKIDSAKEIIKYAIIGIVVALASLVIIRQIDRLLKNAPAEGTTTSIIVEQKVV